MTTSSALDIATQFLLQPAELDPNRLENIINHAMGRQIDAADIYLQSSTEERWFLEDGIVKESSFSMDRGFGLRVVSGEKTGFAYADEIDLKALENAAQSAKSIGYQEGRIAVPVVKPVANSMLYPAINPLQTLSDTEKFELLHQLDSHARALDSRVKEVMLSLNASYDVVLIINHQGRLSADLRPLVGVWVQVVVEENGRREKGVGGAGGRGSYELLTHEDLALNCVNKAVRQAITNLSAVAAPAGTFPIVLGPGWPAVLLHESIGHGLEGDFNRKGSSIFSDRLGQQVASPLCTIVDEGCIPGRRGSLSIDDEGTPTQRTVLIEKGILKGYLQDQLNARLMKMQPTGNGRRESYTSLPIPRMTNTYMLPGLHTPEEIIASVDKGIYVVDLSGGQVDITSGQFVFSMSEAYMIEKGRITHPIKGATLIGQGAEVLKRVSMVGNDLALDSGIGSCGKAGQTVPVGVGQPTLKLDALTVGGNGIA